MSATSAPLIYRIDGIEVDIARGVIRRAAEELHLRPKTFQILLHLIANRDRLVAKEELLALFWKDTSVTDDALTQCIAEMRRAFADNARNPRYFKTIPKRGFRFIAAVEELRPSAVVATEEITTIEVQESFDEEEAPPALPPPRPKRRGWWMAAAAGMVIVMAAAAIYFIGMRGPGLPPIAAGKRLVVVLPFENRSGQADLDWLRDGLPDMLTTTLTRSPAVDVLSREQVALWVGRIGKPGLQGALEAARRSHAQVAMIGGFARLGSSIRIDAQMYDGQSGRLLGAEGVTAVPDQVLQQMDYLSARLVRRLRAPGDRDQRDLASLMTNNLEAYRDYDLGVRLIDSVQTGEGIQLLQKAIALDPNFVMAYARIGYAHAVEGRRLEDGLPYLEKAFRMGDRLTAKDREHVLAWYALTHADYQTAIQLYSGLVSAYPNETEAYFRLANLLRGESRDSEAIAVTRQALAIDPEDPRLYNGLATYNSELGHHAEAIEAARQLVALSPTDPNAFDSLGLCYQFAGQYDDALAEFAKALELKPDFEIARLHRVETNMAMGREHEALRETIAEARVSTSGFDPARAWGQAVWIYWRRGRIPEAQEALRNEIATAPPGYAVLNEALLLRKLMPPPAAGTHGRGARFGLRAHYFLAAQQAKFAHNPEEMIEDLRRAVGYAPNWGSSELLEDALADGYRELGRWDEAIAEYRRALGVFPGMGLARFHLAQSLAHQGKADEAKAEYRKFLEVWKEADADLPEVVEARAAVK